MNIENIWISLIEAIGAIWNAIADALATYQTPIIIAVAVVTLAAIVWAQFGPRRDQ